MKKVKIFLEAYGHFTGKFSDVNTLKNDFLLQFQLFQSQNLQNTCPVEIKDSKVTVFGKDLFFDLMKIPFLGNNETYNHLLDNISDLREWMEEHEPDLGLSLLRKRKCLYTDTRLLFRSGYR